MAENPLHVIVSVNNVPIRLTHKQWAHLVESHDYMAGNVDIVLETLAEPDFVAQGWREELIALRHYPKTVITEKHAVVVYRELAADGFVITAFFTSRPDKILKRGVIWQK